MNILTWIERLNIEELIACFFGYGIIGSFVIALLILPTILVLFSDSEGEDIIFCSFISLLAGILISLFWVIILPLLILISPPLIIYCIKQRKQ